MALFEAPNPTNDPNYLHQSNAPSRLPDVKDVTVPAVSNNDQSLGKLFQGIGDVLGLGVTATDAIIKDNIKKDVYAAVDPIRDAHGADLDPSQVQPIAGTGQRSRNRLAAGGVAVDENGQPTGVMTGSGVVAPEDTTKPIPAPINLEVSRIQRMADAYKAGKLSDSYYDAELVAKTKELKAKYPGYRDEVEQAISQVTGINPANALRRSLLADLNANAAAQASKANSWSAFTEKHGDVIANQYPDYFKNPGKYAGMEDQIRSDVHAWEGRQSFIKAQEAEIGFDAQKATMVATAKASSVAGLGITQMANASGIANPQTLQQKLGEFAKNGGGDPQQLALFKTSLATMRSQAEINLDQMFNSPLPGRNDGATYASIIHDQSKIDGIKKGVLAKYDALQTAVDNKAFDLAATIATQVTMEKNQAAKQLMDKVPVIKILGGLQQAGGDQAIGTIFQGTTLLPQLQKSIVDSKIFETMGSTDPAKPPPGISAQLDELGQVAPKNGATTAALVKANMDMINRRDLPEGISAAAVRNLFDQNFFARLPDADRQKVFTMMSSPQNTSRIAEVAKNDPALWNQYKSWSLYAASSIYNTAAGDAQSYITDKHFEVRYNPETHQIEGGLKPEFRGQDTVSKNQEAAFYKSIAPINQALGQLAPILQQDKQDVNAGIIQWMKNSGIDFNAEKSFPGASLAKTIFDGIRNADNSIVETGKTVNDTLGGQLQKFNDRGRRNLSLSETEEPALRNVIGQAEAGGDYNNVFGMGKRNQMDLSSMTVGEVMAFQKHYTDSGSPSSAAGKYQFLRGTLASLVKEGKVSPDDQFTPDLQDQLAVALMKRRGLDDFRSGKITKEEFANRLAKEWAGLPTTSGMSFYAGDGLNKSTVSLPTVLASLANGGEGSSPQRFLGSDSKKSSLQNIVEYDEPDYQFPLSTNQTYNQFRRSDNVDDRRGHPIDPRKFSDIMSLTGGDMPEEPGMSRDQVVEFLQKNPDQFSKIAKLLGIKDLK